MGLGQQALGRDAGFDIPIRIRTDSSAAIGTASRQGLGKLRHLECHSLWIQQRLRRKEFQLRNVNGTENPADLFTKHMDSSAKLDDLVALYGCVFRDGRPSSAPSLKKSTANSLDSTRPSLSHGGPIRAAMPCTTCPTALQTATSRSCIRPLSLRRSRWETMTLIPAMSSKILYHACAVALHSEDVRLTHVSVKTGKAQVIVVLTPTSIIVRTKFASLSMRIPTTYATSIMYKEDRQIRRSKRPDRRI